MIMQLLNANKVIHPQQYQTSHAKILSAKLQARGTPPDKITAADISDYYSERTIPPAIPEHLRANIVPNNKSPKKTDAPLVAVIIETRANFNLTFVINQMHQFLKIPIQLFHGSGNRDFILKSKLRHLIKSGDLVLTELSTDHVPSAVYNQLVLTSEFWQALIGRNKILIFQTDAVLCAGSPYKIEGFLDYAYIGSGWDARHLGKNPIKGGNGGLSLRDWSKAVECLERFPVSHMRYAEDIYFAFHLDLIGCKIGEIDECDKFSSQDNFRFKSFGIHKMNNMSQFARIRALMYCPTAWRILPRIRQLSDLFDR